MYAGTRARVVTPDGNSEEFHFLAGVMQGDTLAPFLFIMVLDYALRKAISGREQDLGFTLTPRRSRRHPTVVLTDLDYADDISLLSDSVEQAQELLNRVESECAKVGLRLNAKKTEVITYNILPEHPPLITTEGTVLKEVKDFKYLGSWVNSTEQDLKDESLNVRSSFDAGPGDASELHGANAEFLRVFTRIEQDSYSMLGIVDRIVKVMEANNKS
ncbi:hypothetical protein JOQ06_005997 [Pogonophryne albipinna]|uniref:ribonuclease H n=1 Tax=Pogonophryne albipinna TaxID=1090488 RepID=A0AAD6BHC2_9TELE|nr:hypothetical protein JOQ06_005997 [Pogonophryne albipinna]